MHGYSVSQSIDLCWFLFVTLWIATATEAPGSSFDAWSQCESINGYILVSSFYDIMISYRNRLATWVNLACYHFGVLKHWRIGLTPSRTRLLYCESANVMFFCEYQDITNSRVRLVHMVLPTLRCLLRLLMWVVRCNFVLGVLRHNRIWIMLRRRRIMRRLLVVISPLCRNRWVTRRNYNLILRRYE